MRERFNGFANSVEFVFRKSGTQKAAKRFSAPVVSAKTTKAFAYPSLSPKPMSAADMTHSLCRFRYQSKTSSPPVSNVYQLKWAGMAKERQVNRPTMKNKEPLLQLERHLYRKTWFYQRSTRLSGARYILSVGFTSKVLYHSAKLRGCIFARSSAGEWTSIERRSC